MELPHPASAERRAGQLGAEVGGGGTARLKTAPLECGGSDGPSSRSPGGINKFQEPK